MYRFRVITGLIAVAVLSLSIVSSRGLGLESFDKSVPLQQFKTSRTSLGDVRKHAIAVRDKYEETANDLRNETTFLFDLPLIGVAAAAAASLFYGAHTDTSVGLGLGAATLGGTRTYADNFERAKIYHRGVIGLQCVLTWSYEFIGAGPDHNDLTGKISIIDANEMTAVGLLSAAAGISTAKYPAELAVAKQGLEAALEAARTARTSGRKAISAIVNAPEKVILAVETIQQKVTSLFDGRAIDLDQIRETIRTSIKKETQDAANSADVKGKTNSADGLAVITNQRVQALRPQALKLTTATPPKAAIKAAAISEINRIDRMGQATTQLSQAAKRIDGIFQTYTKASGKIDECTTSV